MSFELKSGQIAGLLGPNGAGKTTTIRMIAGFIRPDAGRIMVAGHDALDDPTAAKRMLGYLPESTPLYNEMKVGEYLAYRGKLFGVPRAFRKKACEWAVERCWLGEVTRRRIGVLSKGFKQRVGLAAALLHNPKVLILDEPTNGLDPAQIRETRQLIRELSQDRTTLVCSHILPEVERLCDRVLIVAAGRLRADGTPTDLTRQSTTRYLVSARDARVGDQDRAFKIWASVPYVDAVTANRAAGSPLSQIGWTDWTLTARAGAADLREPIAVAAQQNGILIRELRAQTTTLEGVFMQIMDQVADEAGGKPSGGPSPPPPPQATGEQQAAPGAKKASGLQGAAA